MWSRIPRLFHVPASVAVLLAAFCLALPSKVAHAAPLGAQTLDVVLFRDGDRISGYLKSATKDGILFSGKVTGDIRLSWADVSEIDLPDRQIKLFTKDEVDGLTLKTSVISFYDSSIHLRRGPNLLKDLPIENLASVSVVEADALAMLPAISASTTPVIATASTRTPIFGPVGGQFKISPDSIVRATQKQINLAGAFDLGVATTSQKAFKHQETSLATEANYSDSRKPGASAVITALFSGTLQQNIFLHDAKVICATCPNPGASDGLFLYGIANAYHNLSLGMDVTQSYGGGVGWQGDHGNASYALLGDIRYLKEDLYAPGTSISGAAAGLSEQYSYTFPWPVTTTGVNVYERILFLPVFGNAKAFQVRGSAGVGVPLNANFSVDVDVLDDYLRNAPAGSLQNYNKVIFTLKYTFVPKAPTVH